ncbi:gamma carbonic anhydrase family protein [archaeon]|nr:gamma carbonic anhydrase family protein [archaeon]
MNFIAETATVTGKVTLGNGVSVWYGAVIRGDMGEITIGAHTNIQDNCVIHGSIDKGVQIGECVTLGHGAVVHSCDIGNNVLVGINATILHHAKIGENCMIAAGSVVTPRKEVPSGSVVMGTPGKIARKLTEEELNFIKKNAEHYEKLAKQYQEKKL